MMRWNMGENNFEVNDRRTVVSTVGDEHPEPGTLFGHMVETLTLTLARIGVTSVTVAVAIALLIATVLFGLTTSDATALYQWCPKC